MKKEVVRQVVHSGVFSAHPPITSAFAQQPEKEMLHDLTPSVSASVGGMEASSALPTPEPQAGALPWQVRNVGSNPLWLRI